MDCLGWVIPKDTSLVVFVDSENKKKPMAISELICTCTQNSGITELTMTEYDLKPKDKERHVSM